MKKQLCWLLFLFVLSSCDKNSPEPIGETHPEPASESLPKPTASHTELPADNPGGENAIALSNVAEVTPWGNLRGIRVAEQLVEFKTSLRLVGKDWSDIVETGPKQQAEQEYNSVEQDGSQLVTGRLGPLAYHERFEQEGERGVSLTVNLTAEADAELAGVYLYVELPGQGFSKGTLRFNAGGSGPGKVLVLSVLEQDGFEKIEQPATGLSIRSTERRLDVQFTETKNVTVKRVGAESPSHIGIYIPLISGRLTKGDYSETTFTLTADGG